MRCNMFGFAEPVSVSHGPIRRPKPGRFGITRCPYDRFSHGPHFAYFGNIDTYRFG